jgi:shikimate dehydrogenase
MTVPLRFGLVGHPVRHSLSPAMFAAAFHEAGLPHRYSLFDAADLTGFSNVVSELRDGALAGLNVTAPFKRDAVTVADELSPAVRATGAANVLIRRADGKIVADSTDVGALVAEIKELAPKAKRVAIIGGGGAALAAVSACQDRGVGLVAVTTRSWTDSEALVGSEVAERLRELGAIPCPWPGVSEREPESRSSLVLRLRFRELCATADLVIQATSAGIDGGDSGEGVAACIPWDEMSPAAIALELVYRPPTTPFLIEATSRKMTARNGVGMLVRQAEAAYALWVGAPPPAGVMRKTAAARAGET